MNRPTNITAAILCGLLAAAPIVQVADRVSELLKGDRGEATAASPAPSAAPTPAANASLFDPAPPDDPDSKNFTTDANGCLVNTRDTVTRAKGPGGTTIVTITPVRSGDLTTRN